jgi:hypothetical protein
MSVNARVVLLVKDDTTLYKMVTNVSTKRWTITSYPKFDEPFGVRFHFENFWREPMSVDVIIVLLVGDDKTLYTMVQSYQRKDRLSHYQNSTSLSAFGSILKIFGGTDVG